MIKNTKFENGELSVTYELSKQDVEILHHLKNHGYMWFPNGENSIISDDLHDYGFIKSDDNAHDYTIVLTELGKQAVKSM